MNIYSSTNPPSGFYVYAYIRANTTTSGRIGTPYYIGKGSGKRAWLKQGKDCPKPKNSSFVVILAHDLSDIGALAIERRYIRWYGRLDLGTGILRNKTDGGDGVAGRIVSDTTRLKKSIAAKGRLQTWRVKPCVSPKGETFSTLKDAAVAYSISSEGIRYRCSVNKDGWKYI